MPSELAEGEASPLSSEGVRDKATLLCKVLQGEAPLVGVPETGQAACDSGPIPEKGTVASSARLLF